MDSPENLIDQVRWDEAGLVPTIVQRNDDGRVLMLAYMNRESLGLTLQSGYTHFWSRSRKSLWKKGETSGHLQAVRDIRLDCDGDTVLVRVDQKGPACHTNAPTCFYRLSDGEGVLTEQPETASLDGVLTQVAAVIAQRREAADPKASYVASLFHKGQDAILKKVAEEAGEVLLAAKDRDPQKLTAEVADLLFHTLVAMAEGGVSTDDVAAELARRFGMSGLAEKAARPDGETP